VIQAITSLWCVTGNLISRGKCDLQGPFRSLDLSYSSEELTAIYGKACPEALGETDRSGPVSLVRNFRGWALSDIVLEQMETGTLSDQGNVDPDEQFPRLCCGEPRRHYEAIRKLEFNVVVDLFMTHGPGPWRISFFPRDLS